MGTAKKPPGVLSEGKSRHLAALDRTCRPVLNSAVGREFDKYSVWPGWRALLPVAAAMMVLLANTSSPWTSHRAAQWIGDRSSSLYLWHWPICVALVYAEAARSPLAIVFGIALTLTVRAAQQSHAGQGNVRAVDMLALLLVFALSPALLVRRGAGVDDRAVYQLRPIPEMGVDVPKISSRRMSLSVSGKVSIAMAEYMRRNR